ncbi:PAS domain-containing protein [Tropicibacter sp. R15_0]|uniref:PAS domain-containing protein n=1 Tax=Tropicibacter sp. R15_0 TaxID=2821101 RepID=UPI001ADAAD66|nr:PAS domain-containing protein [Tropicibacter sp. R15_0]MBO9466786.1 PAS domain-containing protein [Tropicibacter sp. R15_0]
MSQPTASNSDALEAHFDLAELFFSRTDDRGIIQAGNSVFQRVSCYAWDDLLNAPHKIIRYPDMPKAVFHLLWETIKSGKPIGAYVKNRSKTGQFYWVFAFVTPIEGGYLSVRMKPTTALFGAVEKEYASLRQRERTDGLEAEESASLLLARLGELGWNSYGAFLAEASVQELSARQAALSGEDSSFGIATDRIVKSAKQNQIDSARILRLCDKLKNSAINLSIQSSKHATQHKLFQVISQDFARVCALLKEKMEEFIVMADEVFDQINTSLFLQSTVLIQTEMAHLFQQEADQESQINHAQEITLLNQQSAEYTEQAAQSLDKMTGEIEAFELLCKKMLEHVDRLGMTGTIGLIETARQSDKGATTYALLEETAAIQEEMETVLKAISTRNSVLRDSIHTVRTYRVDITASAHHPSVLKQSA